MVSFDFLSVGQGDSELISVRDIRILIDGGPDGSAIRELNKAIKRDKYIDILILSHPHTDHFVGLGEVVRNYEVGILLLPHTKTNSLSFSDFIDNVKREGIPVLTIGEGDKIFINGARIDVLSPSPSEEENDPNARSIVALFSGNGARVLFTGDIGLKEEKRISEEHSIKADVLKVAHHGSSGSSSESFLREVSPVISVIEVGKNNRYGFPSSEALERIDFFSGKALRTDKNGSIRVIPRENSFEVIKLE
ncbi:MAG: MBL fold metallo-hydrolase [Candidatus Colwellbacteria bacterium]|nr:MBL fold metallo-hydrolase [Candidatus Colwellbacteria bacterium]